MLPPHFSGKHPRTACTGRRSTMAPLAGAAGASCSILLLLLVPCAQGQGQPPEASEEAWAEGQPPEASEEAWAEGQQLVSPEEALTTLLSEGGCGAFAGLVAATAGVGEAFREQSAHNSGLTILCPDDQAMAEFIPRFNSLTVGGQVVLLLYHGLTEAYSEEMLRSNEAAFTVDGGNMLTFHEHRDTLIVSSWPPSSRSEATITKMTVDDDHLAVYLIDAVLIPTAPEPDSPFWDILICAPLLVFFGVPALFLLLRTLVYPCSLMCRLRRWCRDRVTTYISAARVTPHEQQEH